MSAGHVVGPFFLNDSIIVLRVNFGLEDLAACFPKMDEMLVL